MHGFWGEPGEPTVLFVHGAGGDHQFWTAQTRALARPDRTTVAIDLPGHGASEGTAEGGMATRTAAVEAFLDHHPGDDVTLVGHSMGAAVALDVAARRDVAGLALLGTGAAMRVNADIVAALRSGDEAMLDRWVGWLFARDESDERRAFAKATVLAIGRDVLVADLEAVAAWSGPRDVGTVPSLVISAEQDRMTPPDDGRALAELLGAEYRLVDDGHMFPQTSHRETNRLLAEFLDRAG